MKEFYPYTIIPQKVEKIRQEGIPMPKLPKLLPLPEKVRRKYLGTILFLISLGAFITFNVISSKSYATYMYLSFFLALISLVATIFEFVQYGKLKKQYDKDIQHYEERKEAYKNVKAKQEKIEKENKNKDVVKEFQQKQILEFFTTSYDVINAVHNEYSSAKKRFKLFLEEYFPDEVLDNIKVVHRTKKINYIPDFVIQFEQPKLNVAIEVEEPYTLSNVPENIQKDYEAKDRLRQRFSNELGWIVIVLSEEQAVISPTECCKFVEDSIESIFDNIKNGDQFVNIKPIKKQKMLTGEERAQLKKSKYREKYLIEAGLMDGSVGYPRKKETEEKINGKIEKTVEIIEKNTIEKEKVVKTEETEISEKEKLVEVKNTNESEQEKTIEIKKTEEPELSKTMNTMKTPLEKKKEIENEQMQLIRKIAQKAKTISEDNGEVVKEKEPKKEPIKFHTEENEFNKKEVEKSEPFIKNEVETNKEKQPRKEEDILKDLYNALDKHSKKQKEKEEDSSLETEKKEKPMAEIKKEEPVNEQKTPKRERKIKSAAEIILERKQELERQQQLEQSKEQKTEQKEEKLEEPVKEESKLDDTRIKKEEKEVVKAEKIESEPKKEVVEEKKVSVVEEKSSDKSELGEEAQKNQELIDSYREKIEGAVFDKQWDELMELCDKAIEEIPYWDWAYYRRSTAWGYKKEFSKVILDCNKAIGFNPTLADAYYNRGTARFFLGKYMDACEDYQKSIDLNYIKKADAYFNRGLCYQKLDHKKKAYREFLKAKEMGSQRAIEVIKNHFTE